MKFKKTVQGLPEAICREFELALQRGCWSNGLPLTSRQKAICSEALQIRSLNRSVIKPTLYQPNITERMVATLH